MYENDINKISEFVSGKVVDRVINDGEGIVMFFTDGTNLKIKTFQFQIAVY